MGAFLGGIFAQYGIDQLCFFGTYEAIYIRTCLPFYNNRTNNVNFVQVDKIDEQLKK